MGPSHEHIYFALVQSPVSSPRLPHSTLFRLGLHFPCAGPRKPSTWTIPQKCGKNHKVATPPKIGKITSRAKKRGFSKGGSCRVERHAQEDKKGCSFFAYSWKLPAYSGAVLLTVYTFSFFTYSWSFFAYSFSFLAYSWSFFAYSGKVRLIRALRDCKQRSLTVSKKAPTVSKKLPPTKNT